MNVNGIVGADFPTDLPDGFQKGLGFNITGRTANLGNDDISIGFGADFVDEFFYFIGDMGNILHRRAQILTASFLVNDIGEDLAGRQVGILIKIFIDEALIMAQVQIGFSAVFGYKDFAVLVGAHRAGVNIDIRIQFLGSNFQAAGLQKAADGCSGNALA